MFVLVPMLSTARPEGKMHSSVHNRTYVTEEQAGPGEAPRLGIHGWMKRSEAVACVWSLVCLVAHGLAVGLQEHG